jgi:hypothetical protein
VTRASSRPARTRAVTDRETATRTGTTRRTTRTHRVARSPSASRSSRSPAPRLVVVRRGQRPVAARVEALPLESAAEVLVLLEPALAALEQQAARALERAPAGVA